MQQFDQITSIMPLLISVVAIVMLLLRYLQLRKIHHLFLFLVFVLLAFSYLYIWLFCQTEFKIISWLFPLRQPVKMLLISACYFFMVSTFLGNKMQAGNAMLHILPAIFVFVGFIPFWFVPQEIQLGYLSQDYSNATNNSVIANVQTLRLVCVFIIFNAMLIIYSLLAIREFGHYKKTHAHSLFLIKGTSTFTVTLVCLTLLLVLVDNAYFLGISQMRNSRIMFSLLSSVIILLIFIYGYFRKESISFETIETMLDDKSLTEKQR